MKRAAGFFMAVLAAAALAACGSGASPPAAGPSVDPITLQPMAITAVEAVDAGHVRISARVGGSAPRCVMNLRGSVTDSDAHSVRVQVVYDSDRSQTSCGAPRGAGVLVAVPPLRGRQLVVDDAGQWIDDGGGLHRCDATFGCDGPPRDPCDPAWIDLAAHSGELPPERTWDNRGCDGRWLVLDLAATVTGCQPLDGAPRPTGCAGAVHRVRLFYRFDAAHGWVAKASGKGAGCAEVHATVPEFPGALCRNLPPLR